MKKLKNLLFALLIVVLAVVACACTLLKKPEKGDEDNGGYSFTYALYSGYYGIAGIKASGSVTSVTVPAEHDGKPVKSIDSYAFENCTFKEITLPDSLTEIGSGAFKNCKSLESIVIPNSVKTIYSEAFLDCTSLKTVQLSNNLQFVSDFFAGCSALKSITIPASVTTIYGRSFSNCENLTSITVDARNQNFSCSDGVVYDKYKTELVLAIPSVTSVDIPDSVMTIRDYAFSNCKNLTTMRLPDSVRNVGYCVFEDCTALSSVYIPEDIWSLSSDTFSGCRNITEVVAPLHVLSSIPVANVKLKKLHATNCQWIDDNYFKNYSALEEVELSGAQQIGQYAFSNLYNLKKVTLPREVTKIGKSAFSFCSKLTEVHYSGSLAEWCAIDFEDTSANPLRAAHNLYIGGELVTELSIDGINEIKQYAFNGCNALTKITISDDLRTVGKNAFSLCENLTEVWYTGSLADWCGISFFDSTANPLSSAHNLYIYGAPVTELSAYGVDEIKAYVFSGCDALTKIELSDNLRSLGYNAFYNCDNIVEATMPATYFNRIPRAKLQTVTVTSGVLGESAFRNCTALDSVTLSDGVISIGYEAFGGCTALESITVPSSVSSIGGAAFSGCTALASVNILGSIATLKENTFSGCTALTEFAIPSSVTKIERGVFYGCKLLSHIDVSSSVTEIEQGAFAKCEGLDQVTVDASNPYYSSINGILYDKNKTTIYFVPTAISGEVVLADTLNVIGEYAFSGCDKVTSVTVPDSVTSIGQYAFSDCVGLTNISVAAAACSIGENAFLNADNIETVVLPAEFIPLIPKTALKTVTVTGGAIGENAFTDCTALDTVTLYDGVTSIGADAFKNTAITSIVIPDTVASVGAGAFDNCSIEEAVLKAEFISRIPKAALTTVTVTGGAIGENALKNCAALETVTLNNGITEIGDGAFSGSAITEIDIPSSVTSIGADAFKNTGITSIVIPDTVTSVGENAFDNCSIEEAVLKAEFISRIPKAALSTVTVTGGAIGENALKNCAALETVTLNNGVTEIGDGAFSGTAITGLYIPSSVTSIGKRVFVGCSALNGVTLDTNNTTFFLDNSILYQRQDSFRHLIFAPVSLSGKVEITVDGILSVFDGAFYGCDKITGLDIRRLSGFGKDVFYGCNNIVEVKMYGYQASVIDKSKLQKVEIVGGTIDEDEFKNCAALADITLSSSVYGIGRHAFDGTAYYADESNWANGILYIDACLIVARPSYAGAHTVRSDIKLIADGAFDGCTGLTGIDIPSSVQYLGDGAFDGCGNIGYAKFPLKFVSKIPKNKLQTVEIYGSGTIADNEFNGLTTLQSLTVSSGITKIGAGAFADCSALATVDIADSVAFIGDGAFSGTAYLANADNYENGVLYIVNCLVAAKPTLAGTYTVKANTVQISAGAFEGCVQLTGIVIPASVTSIGAQAFDGCDAMQSVTVAADNANYSSYGSILYNKAKTTLLYVPFAISGAVTLPNTLTSIPDNAFKNCALISAVQIPSAVTSIGTNAFYGCAALDAIAIPSSVTSIGDGAFSNCAAVSTVSVSNAATTFGSGVFDGCDNIVSATMPGSLMSQITKAKLKTAVVTGGAIPDNAFMDCALLDSVTLSDGVTAIGDNAFRNCTQITAIIIPDSVTSIGFCAFLGCNIQTATLSAEYIADIPTDSLTTFTITGGAIGVSAFKKFRSLNSVTLCEGVTAIGESAFSELQGITSLHIPSTVTSIGKNAFYKCTNMESITVSEDNKKFLIADGILFDNFYLHAMYAPPTLSGDVVLPTAVNYVDENAFYGCAEITSVTISGQIKNIYDHAFYGCSKLSYLKIVSASSSGYVSVARDAFEKCPSIVSVYVPADVLSGGVISSVNLTTATITSGNVGTQFFNGCTDLTEITLLEGVTGLGQQAFSGCTGITSLTIPSSVTGIGSNAFYGCSALSEIVIPSSVTVIGDNAFSGCTLLGDVIIPNSVTSIGSSAFYGCAALTAVEIPSTVTRIDDYAFSGCTGLVTVVVPKSVTTLGNGVFVGCENIESATVPGALLNDIPKAKLTSATVVGGVIPNEAFKNCTGLTSITLLDGVTSIDSYAFDGCTGITSIHIPKTVTTLGTCVFRGCQNVADISVDPQSSYFEVLAGANMLYNKARTIVYFGAKSNLNYYAFHEKTSHIEPYAFAGRTNIKEIRSFPASLRSIGEYAFKDCSNLEIVIYDAGFYAWKDLVDDGNIASTWRAGTQVKRIYCSALGGSYYEYSSTIS